MPMVSSSLSEVLSSAGARLVKNTGLRGQPHRGHTRGQRRVTPVRTAECHCTRTALYVGTPYLLPHNAYCAFSIVPHPTPYVIRERRPP